MKSNILFILQLPPPVHGSSMVGEFIKDSDQVNRTFNTRYINLLASKDVSDSGKVSVGKISAFITIWFQLLKELIAYKPALCYLALTVTGPAFFRDVLLVIILKIFGVRRVYHMHNKGVKTYQMRSLYDIFYSFMFKDADVIVLSEHLYEDVADYVSEKNVHVCPNGIPEPEQAKIASKEMQNRIRILFLSNLIQSKGVFVLLQACSALDKKGLEFECIFIGEEGNISSEQINREIKEMNLTGIARYAGKKYGEDKEEAFSQADIFAFPTFYEKECLPLVLLEAMQHSLPIVSTFEGGIRDIVDSGETGYLVPQKDVQALADKLDVLIKNDKLRQQMGKAGRKKYKEQFTLYKFEERMTEILNTILNAS